MKMGNHKSFITFETSMKSIISNFTVRRDLNKETAHQMKMGIINHLRKITTVRRDLNEVYHFKTHDKFFTFMRNHKSLVQTKFRKNNCSSNIFFNEVYHFKISSRPHSDVNEFFIFRSWGS